MMLRAIGDAQAEHHTAATCRHRHHDWLRVAMIAALTLMLAACESQRESLTPAEAASVRDALYPGVALRRSNDETLSRLRTSSLRSEFTKANVYLLDTVVALESAGAQLPDAHCILHHLRNFVVARNELIAASANIAFAAQPELHLDPWQTRRFLDEAIPLGTSSNTTQCSKALLLESSDSIQCGHHNMEMLVKVTEFYRSAKSMVMSGSVKATNDSHPMSRALNGLVIGNTLKSMGVTSLDLEMAKKFRSADNPIGKRHRVALECLLGSVANTLY